MRKKGKFEILILQRKFVSTYKDTNHLMIEEDQLQRDRSRFERKIIKIESEKDQSSFSVVIRGYPLKNELIFFGVLTIGGAIFLYLGYLSEPDTDPQFFVNLFLQLIALEVAILLGLWLFPSIFRDVDEKFIHQKINIKISEAECNFKLKLKTHLISLSSFNTTTRSLYTPYFVKADNKLEVFEFTSEKAGDIPIKKLKEVLGRSKYQNFEAALSSQGLLYRYKDGIL